MSLILNINVVSIICDPCFGSYNIHVICSCPIFPTTPHRRESINLFTSVLARWGGIISVTEKVCHQCYTNNDGIWHLISAPDAVDLLPKLQTYAPSCELFFATSLNTCTSRSKSTAVAVLKRNRVPYSHRGQSGSFRGSFRGYWFTPPI